MGVHVKPDDVCSELDALGNAYRNTTQAFGGSSGFVLGDLNADCRYIEKDMLKMPRSKCHCISSYSYAGI